MKGKILRQTNEAGFKGCLTSSGYMEDHEFIEEYLIIEMDLKGNKVLIEDLEKIGWEKVETFRPLGLDNKERSGMAIKLRYKLD